MAQRIALFNHKGGVSKTTTTFHLGWMLASKGHRVIIVDADPQCNLTGLVLGQSGRDDEEYYRNSNGHNLRDALAPAFESQPNRVRHVDCIPVQGKEGLFLLPGHIGFSEYEVTLGIAQELSGSIRTLQNLPGSISYLLDETANHHNADIVLIDMNPSLSSINQNLLMTSDFFLIPMSPDYFSIMAIDSLTKILPKWRSWSREAQRNLMLGQAIYPFPKAIPRFLGTIIQKYRPRGGNPTIGFQQWINDIGCRVSQHFVPAMENSEMLLSDSDYERANIDNDRCLALIADFNTLIAKSQKSRRPVFDLDRSTLGRGIVREQTSKKIAEFETCFSNLAEKVLALVELHDAD